MSENRDSKSGSQVFERFLGTRDSCSKSYETSESHPPRVSFERHDGESISVAYGRLSLVRHYKQDIYISLGKDHGVHIEGDRLRPLYDSLHQEQVVRVVEHPPLPEDDFADVSSTSNGPSVTVVRKISWPDALSMEG